MFSEAHPVVFGGVGEIVFVLSAESIVEPVGYSCCVESCAEYAVLDVPSDAAQAVPLGVDRALRQPCQI